MVILIVEIEDIPCRTCHLIPAYGYCVRRTFCTHACRRCWRCRHGLRCAVFTCAFRIFGAHLNFIPHIAAKSCHGLTGCRHAVYFSNKLEIIACCICNRIPANGHGIIRRLFLYPCGNSRERSLCCHGAAGTVCPCSVCIFTAHLITVCCLWVQSADCIGCDACSQIVIRAVLARPLCISGTHLKLISCICGEPCKLVACSCHTVYISVKFQIISCRAVYSRPADYCRTVCGSFCDSGGHLWYLGG